MTEEKPRLLDPAHPVESMILALGSLSATRNSVQVGYPVSGLKGCPESGDLLDAMNWLIEHKIILTSVYCRTLECWYVNTSQPPDLAEYFRIVPEKKPDGCPKCTNGRISWGRSNELVKDCPDCANNKDAGKTYTSEEVAVILRESVRFQAAAEAMEARVEDVEKQNEKLIDLATGMIEVMPLATMAGFAFDDQLENITRGTPS